MDEFSAFNEAKKPNGKHHGFYARYVTESEYFIHRSIRSLRKQIEYHQAKIDQPELFFLNLTELDDSQKIALMLENWKHEISVFADQIEILSGILAERQER
jgi:hypothetical protein